MTFESRQLTARLGCNIIGGTWRVSGPTLTTDGVVMTEMACDEPAATFEAQGSAILMQPMVIGRSGERMTLTNRIGSIDLIRRR